MDIGPRRRVIAVEPLRLPIPLPRLEAAPEPEPVDDERPAPD